VVSLGFYAMDVRNYELVKYGSDALKALEEQGFPETSQMSANDTLRKNFDQAFRGWPGKQLGTGLFTHSLWLRLIVGVLGVASVVACYWASQGFPGN
jgi:hypothetical protein